MVAEYMILGDYFSVKISNLLFLQVSITAECCVVLGERPFSLAVCSML